MNRMNEREVVKLSIPEAKAIYDNHMVKDFPDSERKPFSVIEKGMKNGSYLVFGYKESCDVEYIAYAILIKTDNDYLFDYLAVIDRKRNSGIGAEFLKKVSVYVGKCDSIIGEVEDPDYAKTEEERNLQERRYRFYLRNGVIDTGLKVKLFGVDYRVLEVDLGYAHSKEETAVLYKKHYKTHLPLLLYIRKVKVKK